MRCETILPDDPRTPVVTEIREKGSLMLSGESLDGYGLLRGNVTNLNGRAEYALSGELDLAGADGLRGRLNSLATATPGDVYLDLTELEFLGSTGIRVLLETHADLTEDGRRLVLCNVRGAPQRALMLTDLCETLHVE